MIRYRMGRQSIKNEKNALPGAGFRFGRAVEGLKNRKGDRSRKRKGMSLLMAFFLLLGSLGAIGCGGADGAPVDSGSDAGIEEGSSIGDGNADTGQDTGNGEKVMGRYAETMNDSLEGLLNAGTRIVMQEDGSLAIYSTYSGKWVSRDQGDTWEQETADWFNSLKEKEAYIMDIAAAKDGTVAVIYAQEEKASEDEDAGNASKVAVDGSGEAMGSAGGEDGNTGSADGEDRNADGSGGEDGNTDSAGGEDRNADSAGGENGNADSAGGEDGNTDSAGGEDGNADSANGENDNGGSGGGEDTKEGKSNGEDDNGDKSGSDEDDGFGSGLHPEYMVVSPDNTITGFEIPYEPSGYLRKLGFSDDGRLFGAALNGKIYEIGWEQGDSRVIAEVEEGVNYFQIWDEKMVCVTWDGVYLFRLDTGEGVTDKALDEFVDTQMKEKLKYSDGYYQPLLVMPGKDDALYLVCEKGIFRHVWGGSLVEQLADGSLNSLSNPSCAISDGILLENGTFLMAMGGGRLASYAYDPDMPAVPDVQIKAYSLTENERLKKAISLYQIEHPEVYIRYETGMGGDSSVTREDALKKLNTEIAAGTGPDFFLLDDMPIDSYVEKGILADLTPYLKNEIGDDGYFQNILKTFEKDGKIPAVPAEFLIPLMCGREEDVRKMKDLASIADLAEELREKNTEGRLFGPAREKTALRKFFPVCAPVWMEEGGTVNEEALEEFFVQMQRIWNAEKTRITDGMREEEEEYYSRMKQEGGRTEEESDVLWINNIINEGRRYMLGDQAFFSGTVDGSFDFDMLNSYFHIAGNEDGGFGAFCGQAAGVYLPRTVAGISQASGNQEVAGGLLDTLIHVKWDGLVLSKEQTRENMRVNATEDGGSYGSMGGGSKEDGTYIYLDIYPSTEEQVGHLVQIAEQAKTPYIKNSVLESAVCEAGEKVLEGGMDAREGVQEVVKRISLYMAE